MARILLFSYSKQGEGKTLRLTSWRVIAESSRSGRYEDGTRPGSWITANAYETSAMIHNAVNSIAFANPDAVLKLNHGCITQTTTVWYTNPIIRSTTTTGNETNLPKSIPFEFIPAIMMVQLTCDAIPVNRPKLSQTWVKIQTCKTIITGRYLSYHHKDQWSL